MPEYMHSGWTRQAEAAAFGIQKTTGVRAERAIASWPRYLKEELRFSLPRFRFQLPALSQSDFQGNAML